MRTFKSLLIRGGSKAEAYPWPLPEGKGDINGTRRHKIAIK